MHWVLAAILRGLPTGGGARLCKHLTRGGKRKKLEHCKECGGAAYDKYIARSRRLQRSGRKGTTVSVVPAAHVTPRASVPVALAIPIISTAIVPSPKDRF